MQRNQVGRPVSLARSGRVRACSTLVVAALAAGCAEQPTAPDPAEGAVSTPFNAASARRSGVGLDAELAAIGRDAPGFGGMFYDEGGRLNVYVTEEGRSPGAQRRILMRVNASLQAQGRIPVGDDVVMHAGTRTFGELTRLKSRMGAVLGEPGVVFTDIDESRNGLRIGVLEGTSEDRIQALLQRLDVPIDAVSIEVTQPIVPIAALTDAIDPVAGGLQIWRFIPPFSAAVCTLGFNVRFTNPAKSQHYFITNSHCTGQQGALDGAQFRQGPLSLATRVIAAEVEDPPFFPCDDYPGFLCRFSDAALVRYDTGVPAVLGTLYQTAESGTTAAATIDLNADGRTFRIARVRPFPIVGDVLSKVGRTSGWTRGPVVATCIDVAVGGVSQPLAMLCQDAVQAHAAGGDSGSPVFEQIAGWHPVSLVGIMWGTAGPFYVLSAIENIQAELGQFRAH